MDTIGTVYRELGLYDEAVPLVEQALEIRRRSSSATRPSRDRREPGRTSPTSTGAGPLSTPPSRLYERALATRERLLGADHPDLADEPQRPRHPALEPGPIRPGRAALPPRPGDPRGGPGGRTHPEVAVGLDNLAILYKDQGRQDEAEPLYQRSLAIREKSSGAGPSGGGDQPQQPRRALPGAGALRRGRAALPPGGGRSGRPPSAAIIRRWRWASTTSPPSASSRAATTRRSVSSTARWGSSRAPSARSTPISATSLQGLGKLHSARGEPGAAGLLLSRALAILEGASAPGTPTSAAAAGSRRRRPGGGTGGGRQAGYRRAAAILGGLEDPELAAAMAELAAELRVGARL